METTKENKLFHNIDENIHAFHQSAFRRADFIKNEVIVNGDINDCSRLYLVISGTARVIYPDATRRFLAFEDIEAGDFFGSLNVDVETPRIFYASALTDCVISSVAQTEADSLLSNQVIMRNYMRALNEKIMSYQKFGYARFVQGNEDDTPERIL